MNPYPWKSMIRRLAAPPFLLSCLILRLTATWAFAVDLEQDVHRLINEHRTGQGLKPLALSPDISVVARRHSQNMATGRVAFSHVGFEGRRQELYGFITIRGFAENVAESPDSVSRAGAAAVAGWLQSLGHRKNIEGAYELTGIGVAQGPSGTYFFTQLFVRSPSSRPETTRKAPTYTSPSPAPHTTKIEQPVVRTTPVYTYKKPYQKPRYEKDPRKRPGRKRTAEGVGAGDRVSSARN